MQLPTEQGSHATAEAQTRPAGPVLPGVVFTVAAVLSLGYAGWAVTGRLGIFAAFAASRPVKVSAAQTNDTVDTILAAVAGVAVLLALAVWVARRAAGRTPGGLFDSLGLALTAIGLVVGVIGLWLARRVIDEVDTVAAGQSGVTASVVTAMGFGLSTLGLLLGLIALGARVASVPERTPSGGPFTLEPRP
jgi:hypothetical protein